MVRYFPNWLAVLSESLSAAGLDEVPNLHSAVTRGSCKKVTLGVELHTAYPVNVTFTAHDQVTVGNGPQLPSGVVAACRDDVLLRIVAEGGHTAEMTLEGLRQREVRANSLVLLLNSRVISLPLRDGRGLIGLASESSCGS